MFNNNYYNPYPDQLQQLRQQYAPAMQPNHDERIWVQGEDAARAYLVAANSFVRLWDSTKQVFYEKRADQTGRPYMEVFEYQRKPAENPAAKKNGDADSITRDEIEALKKRVEALEVKNESDADGSGVSKLQK